MMNGYVMPKSVPPKIGPARLILAENLAKFGPPDHFAAKISPPYISYMFYDNHLQNSEFSQMVH